MPGKRVFLGHGFRHLPFPIMLPNGQLAFFVYGTLKRGEGNHRLFGDAVLEVKPAWLWGRLYRLPEGYPALELPPGAVLAEGSADFWRDLALQRDLAGDPACARKPLPRPAGDWSRVHGECVRVRHPARVLRLLDELEAFSPDPSRGAGHGYRRSLVMAQCGRRQRPLWVYHRIGLQGRGVRLRRGSWRGS